MVLRTYLAGKIHGVRLTGKNVNYQGSITLSRDLVSAAGIVANEAVQVVNVTTGARLLTYVIVTDEPGVCIMNGGGARLAEVGDRLIVMAFAQSDRPLWPKIVLVGNENRADQVLNGEATMERAEAIC
jgi:aspartate 1-decarboxylase